ncbi:SPOR domain-containing protein [Microbacterium halotolerans]|uniref:SPOR domain-containing protein n=1 Tax=Microbacterium halotolerans TaxID=246613 RepID=UPI000E6AD9E2|nr:SPOR domain-containing protein [Microbacterium halotolerans]
MSDDIRSELSDEKYWFNTKTNSVEFGKLSAAVYRIGPFDTEDEASNAREKVAERSRAWAEDEARDDSWE